MLPKAVRRNRARFPADFMFQLANHEVINFRSQACACGAPLW
ncbi:MAG: ORF6N domain-containing protein [Steroidobacteraceae bacterium]